MTKSKNKRGFKAARSKGGRGHDSSKRDSILETAYRLFSSDGLSVSVEEIANKANVAKQTIYSSFSSKELLFQASINYAREKISRAIENGNIEDPRNTLIDIAQVFCFVALDKRSMDLILHLLTKKTELMTSTNELFDYGPERIISLLAGYLERATVAGTIKVKHPFLAADLFYGSIKGLARDRYWMLHHAPPTKEELQERIEYCVEIFLKAHAPTRT